MRIARMKINNLILHGILLTLILNVRADDQDFEYIDDFSNEVRYIAKLYEKSEGALTWPLDLNFEE